MISPNARGGLVREIAQMLCVLIVVNGALVCAAARLSRFAHISYLIKAFDLLNTALAPVLVVMLLAAVAAALTRPALGLWLAAITVAAFAWQLTAVFADAAPRRVAADGAATLRMLTINAFHDNPTPDRVRAVIEAAAPDIVTVVEGNGTPGEAIARALPAFYRVTSCAGEPCSTTILSRWPAIRVATPIPRGHDVPDMLVARIGLPPGMRSTEAIDVVGVHLPRGYQPDAGHFREVMLRSLREVREGPVILAGDFNLPTGSAALSAIARVAGLRRADRWIATYPANRPFPAFAGIDHVFVDPALGVSGCRRLPFTGSDHYGIVCDIVLPRAG